MNSVSEIETRTIHIGGKALLDLVGRPVDGADWYPWWNEGWRTDIHMLDGGSYRAEVFLKGEGLPPGGTKLEVGFRPHVEEPPQGGPWIVVEPNPESTPDSEAPQR